MRTITNAFVINSMLRNNDQNGYVDYVSQVIKEDVSIQELEQMLKASEPFKLNSEADNVCGQVVALLKHKKTLPSV